MIKTYSSQIDRMRKNRTRAHLFTNESPCALHVRTCLDTNESSCTLHEHFCGHKMHATRYSFMEFQVISCVDN